MSTVFNRTFEYVRIGQPTYDVAGNAVPGAVSSRTVKGTVQPMNGQETVAYAQGNRNTGTCKVYSSERLDARAEDGSALGYVRCGGILYELVDELPFQNLGPITHFKYIASLVPPSQIPEALK